MAFPFFLLAMFGLVMVGLVMDEPVGKSKGVQNTEKGKIEYLIKQVEGLKKRSLSEMTKNTMPHRPPHFSSESGPMINPLKPWKTFLPKSPHPRPPPANLT